MDEYDLVSVLIQDALIRQVKHYGLEGLKEAILRCYANNQTAKERMLKEYYKLFFKNYSILS